MALKESDKKALMGLAFALVVGGGWLFVMPMYEEHQKRLAEITDLVRELRVAHKKAENMSGLASEVDLLKYRLEELKKVLPTESGSFELIEKMQDLAARTGVQIKAITLEERKDKGEGWKAEGLRVQFTCYWFQFIEYLWRIENYERLIDVNSIQIAPEALQSGSKLQRFTIEMVVVVYSSTLSEA